MAYRCRAYPDEAQQQVLNRTFGCVRVVWNRTLAARHARWHVQRKGTSYAESDRALTQMKKDPDLAFLNEVSSVPLQQALRHQHQAFGAFFGRRARYSRFKSRRSRQSAHYTRSAFSLRDGELRLAKTGGPLRFLWSWPEADVTRLDPAMVIVSREPDGRWYGRRLVVIDRWYPSSKTCSACGHLLAELSLSIRQWTCPSCGARHDRDINAAKNILAAGQAVTACGAGVRHTGTSRVRPAVKQEPRPVTAGIPVLQGGE
jgi:transposase